MDDNSKKAIQDEFIVAFRVRHTAPTLQQAMLAVSAGKKEEAKQ